MSTQTITEKSLIDEALQEPVFKEKLRENPYQALIDLGISVPEGTEIVILEETPGKMYVVIPSNKDSLEMGENEIEQISGGGLNHFHDYFQSGNFNAAKAELEKYNTKRASEGKQPWEMTGFYTKLMG